MVSRGEVWLVKLDPTVGGEISKTRPCLIVSPDDLSHLSVHVIAPMTSGSHTTRYRPSVRFQGRDGLILADQLRTISRARMVRRLGQVAPETLANVLQALREMFDE